MSANLESLFKDRYPKGQQLFYRLGKPYVKTASADNDLVPNFIQSRSYQDLLPEHLKTDKSFDPDTQPTLRAEPKVFVPDFVKLDKKNLCWDAYFEDPVFYHEKELHHIRRVKIYYHLLDDCWSVFEPDVANSGLEQGRIFHKQKVPNSDGEFLHWSAVNLGNDVEMFGRTYHICDCDLWTKDFLESHGVNLNNPEPLPKDPAISANEVKARQTVTRPKGPWNQFLEYQGKRLKFFAVWDEKLGEAYCNRKIRRYFEISYFLEDDTVQIRETEKSRDTLLTPIWLKRQRLPKPNAIEHYTAKDFSIGGWINVYSREMFVYDCDSFTKDFFQKVHGISFPNAVEIPMELLPLNPSHHFPNKEFIINFDSKNNQVKVVEKRPTTTLNRNWIQGRTFFDWAPISEAMIQPKSLSGLRLGNAITLYKWKFQLADCDEATLRCLKEDKIVD